MGKVVAIPAAEASLVQSFEVTEEQIAELRAKFSGVTFDTPANYEVGRQALATLRGLRVKVEKTRVDLKAGLLERGRLIDKTAKGFSKLVEDIEDPLLEAKRLVDEAEAKAKRDAERAELIALDAEQTRIREEAEAKAKTAREAEEKRLAEERAALEAEKARQAEANRAIEESQRAERERMAAERAKLDADRAAVEEAQRTARQADAERARAAQEVAAREQAEKDAVVEQARLEAMRPDIEKVHAWGRRLADLVAEAPHLDEPKCASAILWSCGRIATIAESLGKFEGK